MRPVDKGERNEEFKPYQTARDPLAVTIGRYCSYCEMRVNNSIEVEHAVATSKGGSLGSWENFLLACRHCNGSSNKGSLVSSRSGYYWPDQDNTFWAFEYDETKIIQPNSTLSGQQLETALATINLLGLNRTPNSEKPCTKADKRHLHREFVWSIAKDSLNNWNAMQKKEMQNQIVKTALGHGFFSIWMIVFKNERTIKLALINAFPGTAMDCFDQNGNPVHRPDGKI